MMAFLEACWRATGWRLAGLIVIGAGRVSGADHAAFAAGRSGRDRHAQPLSCRRFSEGALLGTDHLGRDLLSRLMWGTRLSLAMGLGRCGDCRDHRLCHRDHRGLLRRAHRQPHHARRRYVDGLSLHPAGAGDRRGPWPGSDERADRRGRRQRALLCAQHSRDHRGDRPQGIRRCRPSGGDARPRDHSVRSPAQCLARSSSSPCPQPSAG